MLRRLSNNIVFWIVVGFLIRLIGVTHPPLETSHSWRQVTGLMVARNFLEEDNNIFYPRVDDTNGESGIVGLEFPVLNYGHYLVSELFGYDHWYGRLLNLIISSFGLWCFYYLVRRFFRDRIAFYATIALMVSIWFAFSRKMMPDVFCVSLFFIGTYFIQLSFDKGKKYFWWLGIGVVTLGILSKIPAVIYYPMLLLLVYHQRTKVKMLEWISLVLPPLLVYGWYFVWNPHLSEVYGNWYNQGMSLSDGFWELWSHKGATLKNFYFATFQGFIFFAFSLIGFIRGVRKGEKRMLLVTLITLVIFFGYMLKSGVYFHHHNYYIIPIVPVFALFVGCFLASIPKQSIALVLLLVGVGESLANQNHDFRIKDHQLYKLQLEEVLDKVSDRADLIAINVDVNPQLMYFSHRKGWTSTDELLMDSTHRSQLMKDGCKFIVIDKHMTEGVELSDPVYSTSDFVVYRLSP